MQNLSGNELVLSLKQMTKCCLEMKALLDNDKNHFSDNAVNHLSESNHQKILLLEQLTTLINELNSKFTPASSSNFLESIEKYADNFDARVRLEVTAAITELKNEIQVAYQYLATNSKIIFTNIKHLHNVWGKLSACRSEIECVYDHKGNTGA